MISELRKKLKQAYDAFYELYGRMNSPRNRRIINLHPEGYKILASVEVKLDQEYHEADILTKSRYGETEVLRTSDCKEALSYVLAMKGCVDLAVIEEIVDLEKEEVIRELGDLILYNPIVDKWETQDRLCSGNVVDKLQKIETLIRENNLQEDEHLQKTYRYLKDAQPDTIPWELLMDHLNLGERWLNLQTYVSFANWLFESNGYVDIKYFSSLDEFKVDCSRGYWMYAKISREYYVRSKGRTTLNGMDLLEHAMEDTRPHFTYKVGDTTMVDNDAIQLANEKIEEMRRKWTEWLYQLPKEEKDALVTTYNNLYNCYVLRKYDGSHMTFPGLDLSKLGKDDTPIELYGAQKDVAWRILQQCGAIVDHQVGSGKSLSCIIAAHEMKRMKIRNKPAILCLKANVGEIAKTFRKVYPGSKVLAPTEADFEKKNRKRLFHEIKNNDWDAVIMTHDQFGKIPQSREIQEEIFQEELDNLERDLEALKGMGNKINRSMRKGLEQRKQTLGVKLQQVRSKIDKDKDADVTFADMGIDHLFIDESHKYKNLTYTTRHVRVAGLGNSEGSQKALNMLFAVRELQKRFNADMQVTFLSGTPISNSLTEMYLLFKYLRPRELARQNILNFDSWAAVFAKKTTDFEFSVTNQIIAKERFRHFIKVPELALFYNEIADFRTKKMIQIEEPEMVEELVHLEPSEDQKEFIMNLIEFARTGNGRLIGRAPLSESEDKARMLIATNYAKKMSTDMRLINPVMYDDHPNNKISVCSGKAAEFYFRHRKMAGTQLIFCDLGTPGTTGFNVYEALKQKLVEEYEIPEAEIQFIHDWEGERKKIQLFKKMNEGDIRILIGSTEKAGTGLNVQQRIVAMHHLDIPWKPAELTQRNGRGVRPGNWLAKLHQDNKVYNYIYATERSLDTYKFTLLKNKQTFISQMKTNELQVRSIDEGSIDEQSGMNFAEYIAILSGDTTLLEKAKIDKKLAVLENLRTAHYREQHNNEYLLAHKRERKEEVDEIVQDLQRDVDLYTQNISYDENGAKLNPIELYAIRGEVLKLQGEEWAAKLRKQEKLAMKMSGLKVEKVKDADKDKDIVEDYTEEGPEEEESAKNAQSKKQDIASYMGTFLLELFRSWRPKPGTHSEHIGELLGFNVYIERIDAGSMINEDITRASAQGLNIMSSNKIFVQHPKGSSFKYNYNMGIPARENSKIAIRNPLNAISRCEGLLDGYLKEKESVDMAIQQLSTLQQKPFSRDEEIMTLRQDSKRLQGEISAKITSANAPVPA